MLGLTSTRSLPSPRWCARERGAAQAELGRAFPGGGQGVEAPAQFLGCGLRRGEGQQGQDERLGVPEGVAVVAGPGEPLGGDGALFGAGVGLEDVEEGEADGLLDLLVAVDLDVGASPEVVEVGPLVLQQPPPAAVRGRRQRRLDLVAHRGPGADAGPAVCDQLLHAQPLSRFQHGGDGQPGHVHVALTARRGPFGAGDDVVGGHGDPEAAAAGAVDQAQPAARGGILLRFQWRLQRLGGARVAVRLGQALVGDQLRLDDDTGTAVDGLHLVRHGGDRPLGQGHQPRGAHPDGRACRGGPLADSFQHAPP